jgi:hypothetical protein
MHDISFIYPGDLCLYHAFINYVDNFYSALPSTAALASSRACCALITA